MKRDITTIIIGSLFLLAGIAVGGSMLGLFDFSLNFSGWWTVFLIVPALLAIIKGGFNIGNIILLSVGIILLLDAQRILPHNFSWKLILPLVLFIVGFQLLFGSRGEKKANFGKDYKADNKNDEDTFKTARKTGFTESTHSSSTYKTASVLFGGQDIRYGTEEFSGATYTAIFGSCTINLRHVILIGDVVITVTALFAGIDLILPENVRVISNIVPILGGTDIKYASAQDPLAPKIIINGNVSFGGVDIK